MRNMHHEKRCECRQSVLSEEQRQYLKQLGLSKEGLRLYNLLLIFGQITAQGMAAHTFDFPSSHYRLLYQLEDHKLIRRHAGRPRSWSALPLQAGLMSSLHEAQFGLEAMLKKGLGNTKDSIYSSQIILGRKAVYDVYAQYAANSQREVMVYAIGIAYSKQLESTQRSLIKRGVRVRHIVQRVQPANYHVIDKWRRVGVNLRHLKRPQGFHFFIIDQKWVCITFTDAQDTDKRLSILTDNPAAIQLFSDQFDQLWTQAEGIKA